MAYISGHDTVLAAILKSLFGIDLTLHSEHAEFGLKFAASLAIEIYEEIDSEHP
jgi:hypothetical protein